MTQSTGWCFTLNNYTDADEAALRSIPCRYMVYGREVAPTTGTPHLQGYIHFERTKRLSGVRAVFPHRTHLEPRRGSPEQAANYCKKDGDFEERGVLPAQGRRTDITAYIAWCKAQTSPPSRQEVMREWPQIWIKYPQAAVELAGAFCPPAQLVDEEAAPREGWQMDLWNLFQEDADDRTITFVTDEIGNSGKSWFCRYCMTHMPDKVQYLGVGKVGDLAHMIDESKTVFLFDVQRDQMQFLQYKLLESLKDKMIISPKYNSRLKILREHPHVVVFSNEEPDLTKLSADRPNVITL